MIKSIRDFPIHNQMVFLRVDFNVPLNDRGEIIEDSRIKAALPTIEYCVEKGAKLVIASHLGRPDGAVVEQFRMAPVAKRLHELLGQSVHYAHGCIGEEVRRKKMALQRGEVLLLENLRFHKEEENNDLRFAELLAENIDVYITDAFGALHRKHASTYALPSLIFDRGMGFLVEQERDALSKIINDPDQPLVMVVGGAKISDKVDVIRNLASQCDVVLIGGGVANTFLKGSGMDMQGSLVESNSVVADQKSVDFAHVANELLQQFQSEQPTMQMKEPLHKIQLPLDLVCASGVDSAETVVVNVDDGHIPTNMMALDIGPKTRALYVEVLKKAQTIFWNGPMGVVEKPLFAKGTEDVARIIAAAEGYAVLGGGDTEAIVNQFGLEGYFSHVSTGGGASLNFLAAGTLPGLEILK